MGFKLSSAWLVSVLWLEIYSYIFQMVDCLCLVTLVFLQKAYRAVRSVVFYLDCSKYFYTSYFLISIRKMKSYWHMTHHYMFLLVGQEIRDRFSGAVEAFARRNGTGHGLHGEHTRHRSSDDVPSSKDVVSNCE